MTLGSLLVAAAIQLLAAQQPAQSQQPPQSPQKPPVFRTGTDLVRVDVTVLDRGGKAVTRLKQEDFVVFEDDVPQRIQAFQFVAFNGEHGADEDLELTIRPRDGTRNYELAREDVRMFLVFWDEYHILPDHQEKFLKDELLNFLKTMLNPTDLVAIMDPWTPMSDLWFSRDRYRLATQVAALRGRQGVMTPRNSAEENHFSINNRVPFVREQVSLTALKSAISYLGTLRDGRKTLLYVSQEFGLGRDTNSWALDVTHAANAENVSIYSINPQGLEVGRSNFRAGLLASVAYGTGGESFVSNSPAVAFRRAVSQGSAAYLIGYSPSPLRQDGAFHKIEVKVKGSGLQVRARAGYLAPDVAQKEAAHVAAKEAELPPPIDAAFKELARLGRPEDEGNRGEVRTILEPEAGSPRLSIVPPGVWLIRRPADLNAARSERPPAPESSREFARTDRVLMRIAIEGQDAASATLSIGLIDRRGKRLTDLPFTRGATGWLLDLPLQSIARGDYLIEVAATAGDVRAIAYVPMRVKDR
jgi:VWFA-related protein